MHVFNYVRMHVYIDTTYTLQIFHPSLHIDNIHYKHIDMTSITSCTEISHHFTLYNIPKWKWFLCTKQQYIMFILYCAYILHMFIYYIILCLYITLYCAYILHMFIYYIILCLYITYVYILHYVHILHYVYITNIPFITSCTNIHLFTL